jgi:L-alanine-DL-glutamate epimerase-like enolase superfamily enzyme
VRITSIEYQVLDLKMKSGYTIAYESIDSAQNVVLKLNTDNGLTGWGCAAPDMEITGETAESVVNAINTTIEPYLSNKDPWEYRLHIAELKKHLQNQRSALAMVDIALYDLISRAAGVPLYKFLGGYRRKIATSVTIGIMPVDDVLAFAKAYWQQGYRILKIKGGLDLDQDVKALAKLREVYGLELGLRFDANQGYDIAKSKLFAKRTKKLNIQMLEQPTDYQDDIALQRLATEIPLPVMADEGVRSISDAHSLSKSAGANMINIKLQKVGGITQGVHIDSVASAAGMPVMVGCLDESMLGIAAGLHFALARPNTQYADLDGHLDFTNDPFSGLFRIENGWMIPTHDAGLGEIVT